MVKRSRMDRSPLQVVCERWCRRHLMIQYRHDGVDATIIEVTIQRIIRVIRAIGRWIRVGIHYRNEVEVAKSSQRATRWQKVRSEK